MRVPSRPVHGFGCLIAWTEVSHPVVALLPSLHSPGNIVRYAVSGSAPRYPPAPPLWSPGGPRRKRNAPALLPRASQKGIAPPALRSRRLCSRGIPRASYPAPAVPPLGPRGHIADICTIEPVSWLGCIRHLQPLGIVASAVMNHTSGPESLHRAGLRQEPGSCPDRGSAYSAKPMVGANVAPEI